jgi:hypothetical protein
MAGWTAEGGVLAMDTKRKNKCYWTELQQKAG